MIKQNNLCKVNTVLDPVKGEQSIRTGLPPVIEGTENTWNYESLLEE